MMTWLKLFFENLWYRPQTSCWSYALWPLSVLYRMIYHMRTMAYRWGICPTYRSTLPVVVVGNIHVGGSGKTPLSGYLTHALQQRGWRVAILSRGYAARLQGSVHVNPVHHTADDVGDEPLWLAKKTTAPVVINRHRAEGLRWIDCHLEVDLVLLDDGLQHLAIHHDVDIAVVPTGWRAGRKLLLPAGPLREPYTRLNTVDAVVHDAPVSMSAHLQPMCFMMKTRPGLPYRLDGTEQTWTPPRDDEHIWVCTAIAKPGRFLDGLQMLGLRWDKEIIKADHDPWFVHDFPSHVHRVLMTEKDAMKLPNCHDVRIWVFPLLVETDPDLGAWLDQRLKSLGISPGEHVVSNYHRT